MTSNHQRRSRQRVKHAVKNYLDRRPGEEVSTSKIKEDLWDYFSDEYESEDSFQRVLYYVREEIEDEEDSHYTLRRSNESKGSMKSIKWKRIDDDMPEVSLTGYQSYEKELPEDYREILESIAEANPGARLVTPVSVRGMTKFDQIEVVPGDDQEPSRMIELPDGENMKQLKDPIEGEFMPTVRLSEELMEVEE